MDPGRQLASEIKILKKANATLRRELERHEAALDDTADRIKAGGVTTASVHQGGAPEIRSELTDALERFEAQRHRVRVALFAYLRAREDASASEIGRSLGISRQLASKLAQEAEDGCVMTGDPEARDQTVPRS